MKRHVELHAEECETWRRKCWAGRERETLSSFDQGERQTLTLVSPEAGVNAAAQAIQTFRYSCLQLCETVIAREMGIGEVAASDAGSLGRGGGGGAPTGGSQHLERRRRSCGAHSFRD